MKSIPLRRRPNFICFSLSLPFPIKHASVPNRSRGRTSLPPTSAPTPTVSRRRRTTLQACAPVRVSNATTTQARTHGRNPMTEHSITPTHREARVHLDRWPMGVSGERRRMSWVPIPNSVLFSIKNIVERGQCRGGVRPAMREEPSTGPPARREDVRASGKEFSPSCAPECQSVHTETWIYRPTCICTSYQGIESKEGGAVIAETCSRSRHNIRRRRVGRKADVARRAEKRRGRSTSGWFRG